MLRFALFPHLSLQFWELVVPGDGVWLGSSNHLLAGLRLSHAHRLEVDESLLTGESLAILKQVGCLRDGLTPLADRQNQHLEQVHCLWDAPPQ